MILYLPDHLYDFILYLPDQPRGKKLFDFPREIEVFLLGFTANCGGLLGLFSGMSILSFCEIFYYLTLRQWNIRLCPDKVIAKDPDATTPKDLPVEESSCN